MFPALCRRKDCPLALLPLGRCLGYEGCFLPMGRPGSKRPALLSDCFGWCCPRSLWRVGYVVVFDFGKTLRKTRATRAKSLCHNDLRFYRHFGPA